MTATASKMALMVAAYRARATRRSEPICSDPWANGLAGALGLELSIAFDRHVREMELWVALRTAYLDRHATHLIGERGIGQVVVLGAGFDTRAARLAGRGARFFEVDHPTTQAEKRGRLAELASYPVDSARYVGCDLESGENFATSLVAAGFDAGAPAVILWEGVVTYLSEATVRATLRLVADAFHPATTIYFDFIGRRMADGERLEPHDLATRAEASRLGEPIRFGTNDPLPLLVDCGFRHVRTVSFDQIALSLTGTYDRARAFRSQGMCLASREPLSAPVGL